MLAQYKNEILSYMHGLLKINGPILRILREKIVGQISKCDF